MTKEWFSCKKCFSWGFAPDNFHELKHFCKCTCGEIMYLSRTLDPIKDLRMSEKDKIEVTLVHCTK